MKKSFFTTLILLLLQSAYSQYLNIWNNIHWHEAVTNANMQMTFSEANKQFVMNEVLGKNKQAATPLKSVTEFLKGKSTIIAKLAAQTGGSKTEAEKLLTSCLATYYSLLKKYRLKENDLADGMALCSIINYNTYNAASDVDLQGLKITIALLQNTMANNKSLSTQTNLQKQEAIEQIAIGTIVAQMALESNPTKAKDIAAGIFRNILATEITDLKFGSNGFYSVNETVAAGISSIKTVFKRSDVCYTCSQFSQNSVNNNGGKLYTEVHYKTLLAGFDSMLVKKGKKTNDIADILTECFVVCYYLSKNEYKLNAAQIASVYNIMTENLAYPYNEFITKSDQQKQLLVEDYIIRSMQAQHLYNKGKKQGEDLNKRIAENNPENRSADVYDAMSRALTTTPENHATLDAATLLYKMLKPLSMYDYILTEEGFIKK